MRAFEEIDDAAVKAIAERALRLRRQNSYAVGVLEQHNVQLDIPTAKLEFMFTALVDAGVLSEGQLWSIQLSWEESMAKQLESVRDEYNKRAAEAEAQARKTRIVKPGGSGKLIVPGQ